MKWLYNIKAGIVCLAAGSLLLVGGCDEFLDKAPSKNTNVEISTLEHLNGLLAPYNTFCMERSATLIFSTDDCEIPMSLYKRDASQFSLSEIQYYLWDQEYVSDDVRAYYWMDEYKKIYYANLVLENLGKVEGNAEDKERLRCEAHFVRAYSYFNLVENYCLPYSEANKKEPGLPIKKTVSFEESVKRATLEATYEFIESDLAEALKTKEHFIDEGTRNRVWRINIAAVNGLAARFYLCKNDYVNAFKYAEAALTERNTMVDYNTEMYYGDDEIVTIDYGTPQQQDIVIKTPCTYKKHLAVDPSDPFNWNELYYYRYLSCDGFWYIPSQNLLGLYDKEYDLRYKYHIIEQYSYIHWMNEAPSYLYPGYVFFNQFGAISGPTAAEMLLIKAECLARRGEVGNAMKEVNILRANRISNAAPQEKINLTATTKEQAVKLILEERRREMPFVRRWSDLRRLNNNEDPNDDVVLEREFFPYSSSAIAVNSEPIKYRLDKNSRRYAAPIPRTEILASDGMIEQNKY